MSDALNQETAPNLQVHLKQEKKKVEISNDKGMSVSARRSRLDSVKTGTTECTDCDVKIEDHKLPSPFPPPSSLSEKSKVSPYAASSDGINVRRNEVSGLNKNLVDKKKFKCNICDFSTSIKGHLVTHTIIHTGELPYSCSHCDYRCNKKANLNRHHVTKHTGEKPFNCDICSYATTIKRNLMIHVMKHNGEKPFQCDICRFATADKAHLTSHARLHTGELPYSCSECDYRCNQKASLTQHVMKHTGEKPFKCDSCSYATTNKYHLAKHARLHTGELPYSCSHCDYRCNQKRQLKIHTAKHN